jgi:hypothetical protein
MSAGNFRTVSPADFWHRRHRLAACEWRVQIVAEIVGNLGENREPRIER